MDGALALEACALWGVEATDIGLGTVGKFNEPLDHEINVFALCAGEREVEPDERVIAVGFAQKRHVFALHWPESSSIRSRASKPASVSMALS